MTAVEPAVLEQTTQEPAKKSINPNWSREEARRIGALGNASRRAKSLNPQLLAPQSIPLDPYTELRLTRVRKQLNKLDKMIEEETDPQKLDRLASASAKLAEQERQLAGRPLPGSLRPSSPRKQSYAQLPPPTED